MIRSSTKILLEILGAALAGLVLLVAFLAWRLTYEGPIHMRFLAPYVEKSIAENNRDFVVSIEDTVLTWAGWPRGLDLRAINLHVRDRRGHDLAILPEVSLTLSARAMLHGLVAPSKVEIISPDLSFWRRRDGVLMFGFQKLEQAQPDPNVQGPSLAKVVEELLNENDPDKPAGYLREISILDGKVAINDRLAGMRWEAEHVNFDLARNDDGTLGGHLSAALPQFGAPELATANVIMDPTTGKIDIDAAFQGLDMATLGLIEPSLTELSGASVILSGRFSLHLDTEGNIAPIDFQVNTADGQLSLPGRIKQPLPIKLMQANGTVDFDQDRLHLEKLALDIGGPSIEVSGDIDGAFHGKASDGGQPLLKLALKAEKYPAAWMDRYWPEGAAENTRSWLVPNIPSGMVERVTADLALRLPDADNETRLESLKGEMTTSGLTVHYLRPMPPITDGTATATFDAKSFNADITGGRVGNIKIKKGYLHITGLDAKDQFIKVGGDVASSLPDALTLLDNPRLGYATKLGLHPGDSGGDAQVSLDFDFPAEKSLTFDRVKIAVSADIQHVAMKKIRFGQDVTDGSLALKLDQNGMRVSGPVVYAGAALDIDWSEVFTDKADVRETFAAKGRTSTGSRALVGYDFRPWVDGPSDVDLKFTRHADGRGLLQASFDLKDAVLAMDFLKWRKEAGVPAKGSLNLRLSGDHPIDITDLAIAGDGFSIAGGATFAPDGQSIGKLMLKKAQFAKSAITDLTADFSNNATVVSVGGGVMDVEPWMAERDKPVTPAELDAEELKPQRPYSIAGNLAQVRISEGDTLSNVTFDLRHDPIWWDRIYFSGTLPGGAPLVFDYTPTGKGSHKLSVRTDDGGGAFKTLGIYDSIKGGKLTITGEAKDDAPHRAMKGEMEMTSFRLLHTPFAVRFLSVAALTGLVDALTGEGFLFAGASAKFTKTRGRVDVADFHSAGPSIGLTSKGSIDMDANTIDLKGALVPAYAFNSILGNIPIIGEFLQGGKGEGLFSATYSITGDLNQPKIDVNGWSALAPGFLRNMFDGNTADDLSPKPRKTEKSN
ncbi:MAG TPA: AsmA-like C-terminal domain-containing protein [Dongiaceae bacterium]|nr:AsmA-like C-terminal domain-containing protein [Dongiaceae bacterium]